MGRIAEALKRAEAERAEKIRLLSGGAESSTPPELAGVLEPASAVEEKDQIRVQSPPPAEATDSSVVCLREPQSAIAEQYRAARTWLLRHNTTGEHRSIVVTSSVPQEGKSVTTLNLAACLAELRHLNVLAVDADLRKGSLASLMGMPAGPGVSDVLRGTARLNEATHATRLPNLWLMPSGSTREEQSADLLSSRSAQTLFDELRERFHYMIVDTPPVQSTSDVGVVGGMCSGVLMVVRMHRTPQAVVRRSMRWLSANNLQVIGCLLTAANARSTRVAERYSYDGDYR